VARPALTGKSASPPRFVNRITYQVGRGTGTAGQLATIEAFESSDATTCTFQAQAIGLTG
jgi:hypothetical protein